jgi:hypothetical protein
MVNAHRTTAVYAVLTIILVLFAGCAQPFDFDEKELEEERAGTDISSDGSAGAGGTSSSGGDDGSEDAAAGAGGGTTEGTGADESGATDPAGDAVAIAVAAESFTLAWDPATGDVAAYEVCYRLHGESAWQHLEEVPATDSPTVTVTSSDLPFGTYEFAVRAVESAGTYSSYHTSLDSSAEPETGWYLNWTNG